MKYKYSILVFILLQFACFKDEETVTKTIKKEKPTVVLANNKIVVHVTNEDGQSLNGITAHFNNTIKIINHDSYFYFNGVNVNKENELLQLTDAGGETYEYNIYSIENEVNYIDVALYQGYKKTTLSSQSSNPYTISDNITIELLSDNYMVGQNNYNGNITIKSNEYDLKNKNHLNALPSIGLINIKGAWSKMEMHTAFRFDVLDIESRKLDLKTAVNAQLRENISERSQLLFYDNKNHEWTILSSITSNTHTFPITKSGIYAIATIQEVAVARGKFTINGDPPKNMEVSIQYEDQFINTKTSNNGSWEAVIPRNKKCSIHLIDKGSTIYNREFTANTNNYDHGWHEISNNDYQSIHLSGQFRNCDNQAMMPCYLNIVNGQQSINIFINNATIDQKIPLYLTEAITTITPIDSLNRPYQPLVYEVHDIPLQQVYICEEMNNQYCTIRQGNTALKKYTEIQATITAEDILIKNIGTDVLVFKFKHNNTVEKITNPQANIQLRAEGFASKGIIIDCLTSSNCGFDHIEMTMIDRKNGWYKGSFKGKFWLKTIQPVTAQNMDLEGEFLIKGN